ncbi:MAG: hypothetical protein JNK77_18475 [Saprospiraceae bacterium]|nr:hypothetical protein [Saprospiraceae bacterium]
MNGYSFSRHFLAIVAAIILFSACGGGDSSQQSGNTGHTASDTVPTPAENKQPPRTHNCKVSGQMLEGNQLWLHEIDLWICIVADSSTYDADYGDSHRILEVYDTKNCQRIERKVLPVNVSPDFAYFLAEITYNHTSNLVAIRGFGTVYLYDATSRKLLPPLKPKYVAERYGEDAQSGMIQRLELWEKYLVGYARDYGSFAFDLSDQQKPKAVTPYAEFKTENEEYNSLFLLNSASGGMQAIVPAYDMEKDEFMINPLLPEPSALKTETSRSARNNRYIVIRDSNDAAIAVDMQSRSRIDLPAEVASQPTQKVLQWIRSR